MADHKHQAANSALNIRCSADARATLEQLLGQPTAIVEIGRSELCLRYSLTAPVENGDKKYKQARQYAAKITGGSLNGRLDRERCRVISHDPNIAVNLDTTLQILRQAALAPEPSSGMANPVDPIPTPDPRHKPATYQINFAQARLPAALIPLTTQPRWVCWRWEWRQGKWTKPPIRPGKGFPAYARSNDPATWGTFTETVQRVTQGGVDGIGFCLLGSDVAAVDLDHCRNHTAVTAWALELVGKAPENTYCEVTVSGKGFRLIGLGTGSELHHKFPATDGKDSFELYRNAARYITVSGKAVARATGPLPKIDSLLDELLTEASRRPKPTSKGSIDTFPLDKENGGYFGGLGGGAAPFNKIEVAPRFQHLNPHHNLNDSIVIPQARDESGSGHGFRFMRDCHAKGMSYEEACKAILADNTQAGEWANRTDERQLERAWERSKLALDSTEPPTGTTAPTIINIGAWDNQPMPEQEWAVPDRYPLRQTGLFSGEGGEGKSSVVLHLCAAHALERDWLGTTPRPGPAIFIDAEDDDLVLRRRCGALVEHYGVRFRDLAPKLTLISLVGQDAVMAAPAGRTGVIQPTGLYNWLLELAGDIKPVMIGIASSADVFAGNEIDRSQVRQFIRLLTRIAIVSNGAVTLITHPSLTGIASGTGLSGSTQWHNSVRARAVMHSTKPSKDAAQVDVSLRQIEFHKNNYGPISTTCFVRYQNGMFVPIAGVHSMKAAERGAKAEEVFVALLRKFTEQKQTVSPNPGRSYAPTRFAEQPEAQGLSKKDFTEAMQRLLDAKVVKIQISGPLSKRTQQLALTGS
jgi:RecA-family ATPase